MSIDVAVRSFHKALAAAVQQGTTLHAALFRTAQTAQQTDGEEDDCRCNAATGVVFPEIGVGTNCDDLRRLLNQDLAGWGCVGLLRIGLLHRWVILLRRWVTHLRWWVVLLRRWVVLLRRWVTQLRWVVLLRRWVVLLRRWVALWVALLRRVR
jgi:hypothetical protein